MAGFDVKPVIDAIGALIGQYWHLAIGIAVLFLLFKSTGFFARLRKVIEDLFFTNWQLALLGSTAIALSLASGYTTFDGLRNFTSAPWLSLAIAFGIQGVMLIVAWLIGESFATGMSHRIQKGGRAGWQGASVGILLGTALVGVVFYWLLTRSDAISVTRTAHVHTDWAKVADVSLYFTLTLVILGVIAFNFRRGGDISVPYVQSVRVIVKNAVLWVMFLASMSASVFFSFDSHFNAIFPADQRKRAAEIRTLNQVGGVVADIGALTQKRQIEEAEGLFGTEGWKVYDRQLAALAQASQGSQGEIEKYFVQKMEERRRGIVEQQERIAGSERGQTALLRKRDELEAELQRIEPTIGAFEEELAKAQSVANDTRQKIAAKRIDAAAEDGGVEGTLKRGQGPIYRQRMAELDELRRKLSITDEPRLKEAQKQRDQASARIVGLKREIATIHGEVAKYKGETETAQHRINAVQANSADEQGPKIDPARVLPAFERARATFRQQPDTERLAALQQQCAHLTNAMAGTPATKDKVRAVDCDPKQAAESAARVFALNAGLVAFQSNCAGGDRLPQNATTDTLLGFGRKCLQDSGLISKDSAEIGGRLQAIDMNRDDKAHRFVVTWNAFLDGNRLAYLALTLAIGVDALVFMAGLFGAAAVKSPLSDVPSSKARSAEQLEAIVKNALGEERLENAELVLAAMRPISSERDYHAEVDLKPYDDESARRIRKVLVAGSSIGAVKRASSDANDERYLVRSELFEYLSVVANTARESDSEYADSKRLVRIVGVALKPDQQGNAEIVLRHIEPINQRHGFMAKVDLDTIEEGNRRLVQDVLNAGMTLNAVQRHDRGTRQKPGLASRVLGRSSDLETTYLVRADLFKTLLLYRAGSHPLDQRGAERQLTSQPDPRPRQRIMDESADLPRLLANGGRRPGNGTQRPSDEHLRTEFRRLLLEAVELTPASLQSVSDPHIAAQALAAASALKREAAKHEILGGVLRLIESEKRRSLETEQQSLVGKYAKDDHALELLNEIYIEIAHRMPALILLPEGGLIYKLIQELEDGASEDRLSDHEYSLLSRLHRLKKDLEGMDASDVSAWKLITRQLEHLNVVSQAPNAPGGDGTKFH